MTDTELTLKAKATINNILTYEFNNNPNLLKFNEFIRARLSPKAKRRLVHSFIERTPYLTPRERTLIVRQVVSNLNKVKRL